MRPEADRGAEIRETGEEDRRNLAEQHLRDRRGNSEERRCCEAEGCAPGLDRKRCALALGHTASVAGFKASLPDLARAPNCR
jgi:hypothetical protein